MKSQYHVIGKEQNKSLLNRAFGLFKSKKSTEKQRLLTKDDDIEYLGLESDKSDDDIKIRSASCLPFSKP